MDCKQFLPKFDENNNCFVEPYLPNNKIGIMHLAAGIWKNNKDMRIDKSVKINIQSISNNTLSKSLRFLIQLKKNRISKNWINKQRRDIYVRQSKIEGYRSRAVYKLKEINDKFNILKNGQSISGHWSSSRKLVSIFIF